MTESLAPIVEFTGNLATRTIRVSLHVKRKMNLRRRLLERLKNTRDDELKTRIKNLNCEIKHHFTTQKRNKVRKGIIPGNS